MHLSEIFIKRPIGTTLLGIAIILAGILSYNHLPVASLPQIDFPTISVSATLPGASPETMATSVSTPLERQLGRIAGITEMTSASSLGAANIIMQFDLARNINGAARDVQAAIIAARSDLPTTLPGAPTYRIVNPADSPIVILGLTSRLHNMGDVYDKASTILQQKLSQIEGVGQVVVGGSSLPALRISVNLHKLNGYRLSIDAIRKLINTSHLLMPKGFIHDDHHYFDILTNDQLETPQDYESLILTYQNGKPLRLQDVATITQSVEDVHNSGLYNGAPCVLLIIYKSPGSHVIETADRVKQALGYLKETLPESVDLTVVLDRTVTIRASVRDIKFTLITAIFLVILVIYQFLHNVRAALVVSLAIPLSLLGTFTVMYFCGYSLDNLSLMALTIATGFVVDDAVVIVENITRYSEKGQSPLQAALSGSREVCFTIVSMSLSIIAVFLPILLMGGIIGALLREFAMTLSAAIFASMILSLTITPMLAAYILRPIIESPSHRLKDFYSRTLSWALDHRALINKLTLFVIVLNMGLLVVVPKGFFPQQDTGRISATIQAQQNLSFNALNERFRQFVHIIQQDPDVAGVFGTIGASASSPGSAGRIFITLKSMKERQGHFVDDIIARLRKKLATVSGATLYMRASQDLVIGGRTNNAQYQYTLCADDLATLNKWTPQLLEELAKIDGVIDMNSDQLNQGLQAFITLNRQNAARFNISAQDMDNVLHDAFAQRQITTRYTPTNQYHTILNVTPDVWKNPTILDNFYFKNHIPLSAMATTHYSNTLLVVNHQGQLPAATLSFNLLPGYSLGPVVNEIEKKTGTIPKLKASFQGTAQAFQQSLASEPYLIMAAILAVYSVLGILYESLVHPLTILSTLPSAGVGALVALILTRGELNVMAIIGILLLIGIVKKNAIMIIDFALAIERQQKIPPLQAIYQACLMRFRPIMMTTMAALLSAIPLVIGGGEGLELRRPLGIAIIGGLVFSQTLTLYTTPVMYLTFIKWFKRKPMNTQLP